MTFIQHKKFLSGFAWNKTTDEAVGWDPTSKKYDSSSYRKTSYSKSFNNCVKSSRKNLRCFQFSMRNFSVFNPKTTYLFLKRFQNHNQWLIYKPEGANFKTMSFNMETCSYFKISHFQRGLTNKNLKLLSTQNPFLIYCHTQKIIPGFKPTLSFFKVSQSKIGIPKRVSQFSSSFIYKRGRKLGYQKGPPIFDWETKKISQSKIGIPKRTRVPGYDERTSFKIYDFQRQTRFISRFKVFLDLKQQKWNCEFNMTFQNSINETNKKLLIKRKLFINNALKGVLLVNFPEKEKNFLIKNLAAENKIALITQSASLLLKDSRNMDDLLGVDDPIQILFDRVKTCIPCICFINNLDRIGKQRYEQEQKSLHWLLDPRILTREPLNNSISFLTDKRFPDHRFLQTINQKDETVDLKTDNTLVNKPFEFDSSFTNVRNLETFNHFKNRQNKRSKIPAGTKCLTWSDQYQNSRRGKILYPIRVFFNLFIKLSTQSKNPGKEELLNANKQQASQYFETFRFSSGNIRANRQKNIAYIISHRSILSKLIYARCFLKTMSTQALKKKLKMQLDQLILVYPPSGRQNRDGFLGFSQENHQLQNNPFPYFNSFTLPITFHFRQKNKRLKPIIFFYGSKLNQVLPVGFLQAEQWTNSQKTKKQLSANRPEGGDQPKGGNQPERGNQPCLFLRPEHQFFQSPLKASTNYHRLPFWLSKIRIFTNFKTDIERAKRFSFYYQSYSKNQNRLFAPLVSSIVEPWQKGFSKIRSSQTRPIFTNLKHLEKTPPRANISVNFENFQNYNKSALKGSSNLEMFKNSFLPVSKKGQNSMPLSDSACRFTPFEAMEWNSSGEMVWNTTKKRKPEKLSDFLTSTKHRKNNEFSSGKLKISETEIIKRTALLKFLQILDGFHTNNGSIKLNRLTIFNSLFKPFKVYETFLALPKERISKTSELKINYKPALVIQNLKPSQREGTSIFNTTNGIKNGRSSSLNFSRDGVPSVLLKYPLKKHNNTRILNSIQNFLKFPHGISLKWTGLPKNNKFFTKKTSRRKVTVLNSNVLASMHRPSFYLRKRRELHQNETNGFQKKIFPYVVDLSISPSRFFPSVDFLWPLWPNLNWFPPSGWSEIMLGSHLSIWNKNSFKAIKLLNFSVNSPRIFHKLIEFYKLAETEESTWFSLFAQYTTTTMLCKPKNYFPSYSLNASVFSFLNGVPKWEIYLKNQKVLKPLNLLGVWPSYIEDKLGPSNLNDGASYVLPEYFQLLGHGPKLKKQGITLIASTKNLTTLDAALLRPGRFDTIINFSQSFSSIHHSVKISKHSPTVFRVNAKYGREPARGRGPARGREPAQREVQNKYFFLPTKKKEWKLNFKQKEMVNIYVWPSNINVFKYNFDIQTCRLNKTYLDQNWIARKKQENELFVLKNHTGSILNNATSFSSIPNLKKFRYQFYPQITVLDIPNQSTSIKTFMDVSVFIQYKVWWSFNNNNKLSWFHHDSIEKSKTQVLDSEKSAFAGKVSTYSALVFLEPLQGQIYKLKLLTSTLMGAPGINLLIQGSKAILQIFFFRFFHTIFQLSLMLKNKLLAPIVSERGLFNPLLFYKWMIFRKNLGVSKTNQTKNEIAIKQNYDAINALGREILISKAVMDLTQRTNFSAKTKNCDPSLSFFSSNYKENLKNHQNTGIPQVKLKEESTRNQLALVGSQASFNTLPLLGGSLPKNLYSLNNFLKPYYQPNLEAWKLPNCRNKITKNIICNPHMEQTTMFLKSNRSILFCTGDFDYNTNLKKDFDVILGSHFDNQSWMSDPRKQISLSKLQKKSDFTQSINIATAFLDFSSKIWKPFQVRFLKRVNVNNAMLVKYNEIYNLKTIKLKKQYFFNFHPFTKLMLKRWPALKKSNKLKRHLKISLGEREANFKIAYASRQKSKNPVVQDFEFSNWDYKYSDTLTGQNLYSAALLVPISISLLKKESSQFLAADSFLATYESYVFRKTSKNSSLNITCVQIYPTKTSTGGFLRSPNLKLGDQKRSPNLKLGDQKGSPNLKLGDQKGNNRSPLKNLVSNIHGSPKPNYFQTSAFLNSSNNDASQLTTWLSSENSIDRCCDRLLKKVPRKTFMNCYDFQTACTVRCDDPVQANEIKLNNRVILLKNSNLVSNEKKEHNLSNTHESFFQNYKMCQLDVSFFLLTFYTMFFAKIIYKKTTLNTIKILMPYKSLIVSHFLLSESKAYGFACKNFEMLIYNKLKNFLEKNF